MITPDCVYVIGVFESRGTEDNLYIMRLVGNNGDSLYTYEAYDDGWKAVRFLYDMCRKLSTESKVVYGVGRKIEFLQKGGSHSKFKLSTEGYPYYVAQAIWRSGLESGKDTDRNGRCLE